MAEHSDLPSLLELERLTAEGASWSDAQIEVKHCSVGQPCQGAMPELVVCNVLRNRWQVCRDCLGTITLTGHACLKALFARVHITLM